jgi:hypothetical protein
MQVEKAKDSIKLVLSPQEAHLLRYALERASFIDTPAMEQASIAGFCSRALELLKPESPEA